MSDETVTEPPRCDCGLPASIGGYCSGYCSDCYIAPPCTHEDLKLRLKAFGRDCVQHGDMTPQAQRMLERILKGEL